MRLTSFLYSRNKNLMVLWRVGALFWQVPRIASIRHKPRKPVWNVTCLRYKKTGTTFFLRGRPRCEIKKNLLSASSSDMTGPVLEPKKYMRIYLEHIWRENNRLWFLDCQRRRSAAEEKVAYMYLSRERSSCSILGLYTCRHGSTEGST